METRKKRRGAQSLCKRSSKEFYYVGPHSISKKARPFETVQMRGPLRNIRCAEMCIMWGKSCCTEAGGEVWKSNGPYCIGGEDSDSADVFYTPLIDCA